MTKHLAFQDVDKDLKLYRMSEHMNVILYSNKLTSMYNIRFSYSSDKVYLTDYGRYSLMRSKRGIYIPFIINNIKIIAREINYELKY